MSAAVLWDSRMQATLAGRARCAEDPALRWTCKGWAQTFVCVFSREVLANGLGERQPAREVAGWFPSVRAESQLACIRAK